MHMLTSYKTYGVLLFVCDLLLALSMFFYPRDITSTSTSILICLGIPILYGIYKTVEIIPELLVAGSFGGISADAATKIIWKTTFIIGLVGLGVLVMSGFNLFAWIHKKNDLRESCLYGCLMACYFVLMILFQGRNCFRRTRYLQLQHAPIDGTCSICLEEFQSAESAKRVVQTTCNHLFHYACIDLWLSRNPSCPNCRAVFPDV